MLGLAQGERHVSRDEKRLGRPMYANPLQASQPEDIQVFRGTSHRRIVIGLRHEVLAQTGIILRPQRPEAGAKSDQQGDKQSFSHV